MGEDSTKMLRSSLDFINVLNNIHEHLKKGYDYLLVIVGDTGDGKSHFALNLLETWYEVILKKPVTPEMISQINQDYKSWLHGFQMLKPFDMNIYDEGSRDLAASDFMTRISKDIIMLFDVFRVKQFFSVVILPNFFRLNKTLREDRLRGLVYVYKRGSYRYYTRKGIRYLNAYNQTRKFKNMNLARPFLISRFPEYKGILREPYEKKKVEGVDEVIDQVILGSQKKKPQTMVELYKDKVKELYLKGKTNRDTAKLLGISTMSVSRCIVTLASDKEISI